MQAYAKDSLNNSLGGSGPLNAQADHTVFMGHGDDDAAFRDYAGKVAPSRPEGEPAIFNPTQRIDAIHGDQSEGLGTSTFLEGTPAARSAITRTRAERQQELAEGGAQGGGGGLQRKKSLAQRLRMNKGGSGQRVMSPDAYGGRSASAGINPTEGDPFSEEFSRRGSGAAAEESISVRRPAREGAMSPEGVPARRRAASGAALERRATTDATSPDDPAVPKPSGILGRMKSLKGGRRPPRPADSPASPPPSGPPGAAL